MVGPPFFNASFTINIWLILPPFHFTFALTRQISEADRGMKPEQATVYLSSLLERLP
jgi:hypothetical protein